MLSYIAGAEISFIIIAVVLFIWAMKKRFPVMMFILAFSVVIVSGCRYQMDDTQQPIYDQPKYTKSTCGCL